MRDAPRTAWRGADVAFVDIVHEGVRHRVQVKRVWAAKRFTLRIRAASRDAVVTMPPRGSAAAARSFVERHAAWIGSRLQRLPAARSFGIGSTIPIRGIDHVITHRPGSRGVAWIEAESSDAPPRLCIGADAPFVARRVKDFLVAQARRDLAEAVSRHARTLGVARGRLTLRDTSSRWGSCSTSGSLSFSWRLIMAPHHVLDYLAAHEVAHLVEMNHSPAFWGVVATLVPDYRRAEAWLKLRGADLMRFAVTDERP